MLGEQELKEFSEILKKEQQHFRGKIIFYITNFKKRTFVNYVCK